MDDFRLFGLDKSSGKLGEDWSNINKEHLLKFYQKYQYYLNTQTDKFGFKRVIQ